MGEFAAVARDMEVGDRFQDFPFIATARPNLGAAMATTFPACNRAAELIELHKLLPDEEYFEGTEESYVELCLSYVNNPCGGCGEGCQCDKYLYLELDGESTDTGILMTSTGPVRVYDDDTQFPMKPREVEATISIFDEAMVDDLARRRGFTAVKKKVTL